MPTFSPDKNLKIGDYEFKTCVNVIYVKWMDNWAVTLIRGTVGNLNQILPVVYREKVLKKKRKKLLANLQCPVHSL